MVLKRRPAHETWLDGTRHRDELSERFQHHGHNTGGHGWNVEERGVGARDACRRAARAARARRAKPRRRQRWSRPHNLPIPGRSRISGTSQVRVPRGQRSCRRQERGKIARLFEHSVCGDTDRRKRCAAARGVQLHQAVHRDHRHSATRARQLERLAGRARTPRAGAWDIAPPTSTGSNGANLRRRTDTTRARARVHVQERTKQSQRQQTSAKSNPNRWAATRCRLCVTLRDQFKSRANEALGVSVHSCLRAVALARTDQQAAEKLLQKFDHKVALRRRVCKRGVKHMPEGARLARRRAVHSSRKRRREFGRFQQREGGHGPARRARGSRVSKPSRKTSVCRSARVRATRCAASCVPAL